MAGNERIELTTVGVDFAVLHERTPDGVVTHRSDDLVPGHEIELLGVPVTPLAHPGGELLCRFATVNDVHFGETRAGHIDGLGEDFGPTMSVGPGETPYPQTMNRGACAEISAIDPAVIVVKGDMTTDGTDEEFAEFLEVYSRFGDRLCYVRGNHDAYRGQAFADWPTQCVYLPGVTLAVLDTAVPGKASGAFTQEQLDWLEEVASSSDVPVLVFGHHHIWNPNSGRRPETYFGVHPDWSEKFVDVVARHAALAGYFAGHTHRNRVRRFSSTGDVPYVEVGCVKDFPGSWAEYQVYEGGILQIHHRISTPEALSWSERCRAMFAGAYPAYSFGQLADRCFTVC